MAGELQSAAAIASSEMIVLRIRGIEIERDSSVSRGTSRRFNPRLNGKRAGGFTR
jgi:hypothetical protein